MCDGDDDDACAYTYAHTIVRPKICNVVATVNVCCRLNLREIVFKARNAEYNPRRFAAVIVRIRDPKATALMFASGKVVITGARGPEAAHLAARKFARMLSKLGFPVRFAEFKLQNVVASCALGHPLDLNRMAQDPGHGRFSSYEAELFPGLIYRMVQPRVVLLCFHSGKIVFTGSRCVEDIETAFANIRPVLQTFRREASGA